MKLKRIIVILLVFILFGGVSVCVYAYNNLSMKISKAMFVHELESVDVNTKKINMPKKSIVDNKKEIQLEYKSTKYDKDIYVSSDKDEYIYKDDNLVGFIKSLDNDIKASKLDKNIKISKLNIEEAKKIAETFLQKNILDSQKYEFISSNYITSYGEYAFTYNNKLNGIDTNDIVRINVNNTGEVVSFSQFNGGAFEKFSNIKIDEKFIQKEIEETIKNKYDADYVDFEIIYNFLNIVNDKLVMQFDVNIEVSNGIQSSVYDTIIYELN